MASKYTELRCYIISPGVYQVTLGDNITGVSIHIGVQVPGSTVIRLPTDSSNQFSFYDCHVRLDGYDNNNHLEVIALPSGGGTYDKIYFDNALLTTKYVDFRQNPIGLYGSTMLFENGRMKGVIGFGSEITINVPFMVNNDPDFTPFDLNQCKFMTTGTWNVANLSAIGTVPYFKAFACDVVLASVILQTITNTYTYGLDMQYTHLNITSARLSTIGNNAQSGKICD